MATFYKKFFNVSKKSQTKKIFSSEKFFETKNSSVGDLIFFFKEIQMLIFQTNGHFINFIAIWQIMDNDRRKNIV